MSVWVHALAAERCECLSVLNAEFLVTCWPVARDRHIDYRRYTDGLTLRRDGPASRPPDVATDVAAGSGVLTSIIVRMGFGVSEKNEPH